MNENDIRIDQFKSEIDGLKLKGSSSEGEKRLLVLGVVLLVAGVLLALFGAIEVGQYPDSPADQRAYMAQGSFLGLALIIAGAALFVRFSLARYLRFWMIRMTYESRANTDRVVDAIERAAGLDDASYAAATQPATQPTVEAVAPQQPPPPPPFQ
ncbi:unannotated protein [freshwater metagenome]|uniref:Unannotated protein n=1 Tax=freshwater metagenome TaxID=449393 RepID=A0A6J6RYU2_9ZZZZ|nr:hypothetical protein [Actinomycetota bacterium]MTA64845.1 hypothetical protein [Actinomycetota bacterium]